MKLFRVEPIGRETDEVESLTSYVIRLAKAHGVTVGRLLDELKSEYSREYPNWQDNCVTKADPAGLVEFVRPVDSAAEILAIVEHFTGVSGLRATTFQALREACYRSVGLFHNHVRWCPECLREDHELGLTPYLRLYWSLKEIKHCHKHGVPLITRCASCYRRQNSTNRRGGIHRCHKCRATLFEQNKHEELISGSELDDYRDLRELTEFVSSHADIVFEDGAARRLLQAIFDEVWHLEEEREFWKVLPKEQSLMISYSDKKLTMKMLRRIAFRLGISLPGLLAGEVQCWTAQLDPRWLKNLPANLNPGKRRKKHDRKAVLERLRGYLEDCDPDLPPPLAEVAKAIGISTGGMEYMFPVISQEIKADFQEWRIQERERKRVEAYAAGLEYLASDRQPKSRKDALRTIRAETGLPKNVLREQIAKCFLEST